MPWLTCTGWTDNERRPKACIINPESTRPKLISIYSFALLWFVQRTWVHITSKPYPHTSAVFTVQWWEKKKKKHISAQKSISIIAGYLFPKCVLKMHKKALCRCFQGVYEATVWLKQVRHANFEFNRRKTVSAASKKALKCHCVSYLRLWPPQPGALVEECRVYFQCSIYK